MKILCIGDIHGRDIIDEVRELEPEFEKIVFTGDYVDSSTETSKDIVNRLLYTIQFKKDFPEKTELLLGNHDIQYFYFHMKEILRLLKCVGYRSSYAFKLNMIYQEHKKLFKAVYLCEDSFLFSHAGISTSFYTNEFKNMEKLIPEHLDLPDLAEKINFMFEFPYRYTELFNVGPIRGGDRGSNGGPFWADMSETRDDYLAGYHQIVGHSHRTTFQQTYNMFKTSSISYIDILPGVLEDDPRLLNNKFYVVDTERYDEQLE